MEELGRQGPQELLQIRVQLGAQARVVQLDTLALLELEEQALLVFVAGLAQQACKAVKEILVLPAPPDAKEVREMLDSPEMWALWVTQALWVSQAPQAALAPRVALALPETQAILGQLVALALLDGLAGLGPLALRDLQGLLGLLGHRAQLDGLDLLDQRDTELQVAQDHLALQVIPALQA